MLTKFTVNGSLIPQDPEANDMCILFLKYGRCRFKQKCKKSHWIPPLPEGPHPDELKPPLPNDEVIDEVNINQKLSSQPASQNDLGSKTGRATKISAKTYSKELISCSKKLNCSDKRTTLLSIGHVMQDENGLTNKVCDPCKINMKRKIDNLTDTVILQPKRRKYLVLLRRFRHIFKDHSNEVLEHSGVAKMFCEAGAYYDRLTQKVNMVKPPQNKVEKHRLKILRRLHWKCMQRLDEKLAHFPPSYFLKFDRSKINFTRLRPYVYILIHECLNSGLTEKPVKPSSFDILIADTLIAYLDNKCVTAQEAEGKLNQWGSRAVRARQCIDHLWHIMAISSKSSEGCASEIIDIEQDVLRGSRTSLDYAHACSLALRQTKFKLSTANDGYTAPRKIISSVKQGLKAVKRKVSQEEIESVGKSHGLLIGREIHCEKRQKMNNTTEKLIDSLSSETWKRRRRSRQFKNVSLSERKEMKTRCVHLLSTLT